MMELYFCRFLQANSLDVIVTSNVSIDETTIDAGASLTVNSGITLTVANGSGTDFTITGDVLNNGTVTIDSGTTVNYNGGNQTVLPLDYSTLSFTGSTSGSTKTFADGTTKVAVEIDITDSLRLTGSASDAVTVQVTTPGTGGTNSRVFSINASGETISISGITLKGGDIQANGNVAAGWGGTIYMVSGTLTLDSIVVTGSRAYTGGGVFVTGSTLNITNSTISGCSSQDANNSTAGGGGLFITGNSTVTITDSTIADNTMAGGHGGGAGLKITSGSSLTIESSTLSGNSSNSAARHNGGQGGGGIYSTGTLTIVNSTISGNNCTWVFGGAILSEGGSLTLIDSTVSGNTVFYSHGYSQEAVSVKVSATAYVLNSIIAGNLWTSGDPDVPQDLGGGGTIYAYNTWYGTSTSTISGNVSAPNIIEVFDSTDLAALADNGGVTETRAVDYRAPVIEAGTRVFHNDSDGYYLLDGSSNYRKLVDFSSFTPADPAGDEITDDQRGAPRHVTPTMGAYEFYTDYRTSSNGDWDTATNWEVGTGLSYATATTAPTAENSTSIIINHSITAGNDVGIDQTTVSSGGTLTIENGVTLTVADGTGTDLTVTGSVSNSGSISGANDSLVLFNGSSSQTLGGTNSFHDLTIDKTSGGLDASGATSLSVADTLSILGGTFTSSSSYHHVTIASGATMVLSGDITVSGDWTNNGTFTPNTFGVEFNAPSQTIDGTTTFYDLTYTAAGSNLSITAGTTQKVTNDLTLKGSADQDLFIRSTSSGTQGHLDWSGGGTLSLQYLDVQDINSDDGDLMLAFISTDSGNNDNWVFDTAPNAPASPLCEGRIEPTSIVDLTPDLSWSFSDDWDDDSQSAYQVIVGSTTGASDLWNPGKVASTLEGVVYAGTSLSWSTTYFWQVKTWDSNDQEGTYCASQEFTIASQIYVDHSAYGLDDGSSWEHAFTDLQDALDAASSGVDIWVADGIYYPSEQVGGTGDRFATYQMSNGVGIYGGFEGLGDTDILLRRQTGDWGLNTWLMDGTSGIGAESIMSPIASTMTIQGTGDLNGDGDNDILWLDSTSQKLYVWLMDGTSISSTIEVGEISASYSVLGICTLNRDEYDDILLQNTTTGAVSYWLQDGTGAMASSGTIIGSMASNWTFKACADLDGDWDSDVIWKNTTDNKIYGWLLEGMEIDSSGIILDVSIGSTDVLDVGHFNDDLKYDIIFQNPVTGDVIYWLMDGLTMIDSGIIASVASTFQFQQMGDFNDDGMSDFLWYRSNQSALYIWLMDGIGIDSTGYAGTISSEFHVVGTGFFDDGEETISERDPETHTTILSGDIGTIGDTSDNAYHVFYHPSGTALDNTAILDGFTVTGGNADLLSGDSYQGGGMYNNGSSPTIQNVTFSGNDSYMTGGAIINRSSSDPVITNCTFIGNTSDNYGGAIYNNGSSPTISGSSFSENTAWSGAGIRNESSSSPNIINCSFTDNELSHAGGGISNSFSSPTIIGCTFSGNTANGSGDGYGGGGIYNYESSPSITNCTFTGNSVPDSKGGAIYNYFNCTPVITNCTLTGNSAKYGGGIYNQNSSHCTITNTILWGNSSTSGVNEIRDAISNPTVSNCVIQGGYFGGGTVNDIITGNPLLSSLADNGGPIQTMALLAGSSAIHVGTVSGSPSTDQRGYTRTTSGACDIGAFETNKTLGTAGWTTASDWSQGTMPTSANTYRWAAIVSGTTTIGSSATVHEITILPTGTLEITGTNIFAITGGLHNDGSFPSNTSTVRMSGSAGQTITGSQDLIFHDLTIDNSHTTEPVDASGLTGTLAVTGTLTIADGIFLSSSDYHHVTIASGGTLELTGDITVSGTWTNNGGTFTPNSHMVTLDGSSQTISGSTTFYDLIKLAGGGYTLSFEAGSTQTVSHNLILNGTSKISRMLLRSTSDGSYAYLDQTSPTATQDLDYLDVQDINSSGGIIMRSKHSVGREAHNVNWRFGIEISGTVYAADRATPLTAQKLQAVVNGAEPDDSELQLGTGVSTFTFENIDVYADDYLLIYLDDGTEVGCTITVIIDDGTDLTGLDIYADHVTLMDVNTGGDGEITNAGLDTVDRTIMTSDTDILYDVDDTTKDLTLDDGTILYVPSEQRFDPGATLEVFDISFAGTLVLGGDLDVNGDWVNLGGTFTYSTYRTTFDGTATQTIGGTTSTTFGLVTFWNSTGFDISEDQNFGQTTLEMGTSLDASGGNNSLTFTGTVNGVYSLTIDCGTGTLIILGETGSGIKLASVDLTAANISVDDVHTTGTQEYTGAIALNDTTNSTYTTEGSTIIMTGAVSLNDPTILRTTENAETAGADITITGTVNGAYGLTMDAGYGTIFCTDDIGGSTPLASGSFSAGSFNLQNVFTTGLQAYFIGTGNTGSTSSTGDLNSVSSTVTIEGGSGDDDLTIEGTGSSGTGSITFSGGNGDDNLTVDFSSDDPIPAGTIIYNGQGQSTATGDILIITGGTFSNTTYNFTGSDTEGNDGSIILDSSTITFTGLEPIVNDGTTDTAVFNLTSSHDSVTLEDDIGIGSMRLLDIGGTIESTVFTNPDISITINGNDGDDTIVVSSFDSMYSGTLLVNGGSGDDTFTITPAAQIGITVDGGSPSLPTVPGDTMIFDGTGSVIFTAPGEGIASSPGKEDVIFSDIETFTLPPTRDQLIINLSEDADVIVVSDDGTPGDGVSKILINGTLSIVFSGIEDLIINGYGGNDSITILNTDSSSGLASIIVNGGDGDDTIIVDCSAGNPIPDGGLFINGQGNSGSPGDSLSLIGGNCDSQTFIPMNANDGSIDVDGQLITYTGLEPIYDTVSAVQMDIFITSAGNTINIVDGPGIGSFTTTQINDAGTFTFESIEFANKGKVTINGLDGSDIFNVNHPNPSTGLTSLELFGNELTDGALQSDDNASDDFNILAIGSGATLKLFGQGGSDTFALGSASNSLGGILGEVTISGNAHDAGTMTLTIHGDGNTLNTGDILNLNDQGDAGSFTYALNATTFARTGTGTVAYATIETLNMNTSQGAADVDVTNTAASLNTTIITQDGADDVDVATTGADSNVILNTAGGVDDVKVVTTGGDGLDGNSFGSFLLVNGGTDGDTITLQGSGTGSRVELNGQGGKDTINVRTTGALSVTTINGGDNTEAISLGSSANSLGGILGDTYVNGNAHDAGTTTFGLQIDYNTLNSGDLLYIYDQGDAGSYSYSLTDTTFSRTGTGTVTYATIEYLQIATSIGSANMDVLDTADSVITLIYTQDAPDDIDVTTTGLDSNVEVGTGGGSDTVDVVTSGGDGTDSNAFGSFVFVRGGDQDDTLILMGTGAAGRTYLSGGDGSDTIGVRSTSSSSYTYIEGWIDSDVVNIGNSSNSLSGILGDIHVEGGDQGPGTTTLTIGGGSNTLDSGDFLNLNDQGDAGSYTYALDATTFTRTGIGTVTYAAIETLNLNTAQGASDVDMITTTDSVNTTITTQDGADDVDVATTGADSNVIINTAGGADDVTIMTSGGDGGDADALGSFLQINAGAGGDTMTLQGSGPSSRVELNGQAGTDTINIRATGILSVTNINGGDTTDIITMGSVANSLGGLLGASYVNGNDHDTGTTGLTIMGDTNILDTGDILNLNDHGDTGSYTYILTTTTITRTGTGIIGYDTIETMNISTSMGAADIDVLSSGVSVNTTIASQDGADDIDVTTTGEDSNMIIRTYGGGDAIDIQSTGGDGVDTNILGSFLIVNGQNGNEQITLRNSGGRSSIQFNGGLGDDEFFVFDTNDDTNIFVFGGDGNDTLFVDFDSGSPLPQQGIEFHGESETGEPGDMVVLQNGTVGTVTHTYTNPADGLIDVDGRIIIYTGLSPIFDYLIADHRISNFGSIGDEIFLYDNVVPGMNTIESTASSEITHYANPLLSMTVITGSGNDVITLGDNNPGLIPAFDSLFTASLIINGDGDYDTIYVRGTVGTPSSPLTSIQFNVQHSNLYQPMYSPAISGTCNIVNVWFPALIQNALDIAHSTTGCVITVYSGTYPENLTSWKPDIHLKSDGGSERTTISANDGNILNLMTGTSGFTLGGDYGIGFTLRSSGITSPDGVDMGITGIDLVDLLVTHNNFVGPIMDYGIHITGINASVPTVNSLIGKNRFYDCGTAIAIFNGQGANDLTITRNCIFSSVDHGILVGQSLDGTGDMRSLVITENSISNSGVGLRIKAGSNIHADFFVIKFNNFVGNTVGLQNETYRLVTAIQNFWGSPNGPFAELNPNGVPNPVTGYGTGDVIQDHVIADPWLSVIYHPGPCDLTIILTSGWNLISITVELDDLDGAYTASIFASEMNGQAGEEIIKYVVAFNSSTGLFEEYVVDSGIGNDFPMEYGRAYYVYSTSPFTTAFHVVGDCPVYESFDLVECWNLIGWLSMELVDVGTFAETIDHFAGHGVTQAIVRYDDSYGNEENRYIAWYPGMEEDLFQMTPGEAYWIFSATELSEIPYP